MQPTYIISTFLSESVCGGSCAPAQRWKSFFHPNPSLNSVIEPHEPHYSHAKIQYIRLRAELVVQGNLIKHKDSCLILTGQ